MRKLAWITGPLALIGLLAALSPAPAPAASFTGLGDIPGGPFASSATGVSDDGRVVVGRGTREGGSRPRDGLSEAFRWTAEDGLEGLGSLFASDGISSAAGVSGDGSIIVGSTSGPGAAHAFRWDRANGMVALEPASAGASFRFGHAVSSDGTTIAGGGFDPSSERVTFRWTAETGGVPIDDLPGGHIDSIATDLTHDGSVIVGLSLVEEGYVAFRWDALTGTSEIPTFAGREFSDARAVSRDGSIIIGIAGSPLEGIRSYRWDESQGTTWLEDPSGAIQDLAVGDLSGDGAVMIGSGRTGTAFSEPVIWDATHGWRELDVLLATLGVDLSGWTLTSANAISADGRVIVGHGQNPAGEQEAWVAVIPEPGPALLLALGLAGLARSPRPHRMATASRSGPTRS